MIDDFKLLKKYRHQISKQQYRTFKGQIISGDSLGFRKGLKRVLELKQCNDTK